MKLLKAIGMIFIALVVVGTFARHAGPHVPDPRARTRIAIPDVAPIYRTTAVQLAADYQKNQVATDLHVKDRRVEITGIVAAIDKDASNVMVVSLATANASSPARMHLKDGQIAKAALLQRGAPVEVVCDKMMRALGSPAGYGCAIEP